MTDLFQCHSDASAISGKFASLKFPVIAGHEGSGVVESIGEGVTRFKPGDHVLTMLLPQCRQCRVCKLENSNLCLSYFGGQLKGVMADGTSRFSCRGQPLFKFIGCSTFAEFTVMNEMNLVKVDDKLSLEKVCLLSCCVPTGFGAAVNAAKVRQGSTCAVWGLGALGLTTILGCKFSGASRIIGIDINPSKFKFAKEFGATECINPKDISKPLHEHLREITSGGADYTFECVGNVLTIKEAYDSAAFGYGECILIGVVPSGQTASIDPIGLQLGRVLKGTMIGGYKGIDGIAKLVEFYSTGALAIDGLITHNMGLEKINDAFDLLLKGKSIRTVINL